MRNACCVFFADKVKRGGGKRGRYVCPGIKQTRWTILERTETRGSKGGGKGAEKMQGQVPVSGGADRGGRGKKAPTEEGKKCGGKYAWAWACGEQ